MDHSNKIEVGVPVLKELSQADKDAYKEFTDAHGNFLQDWSWGDFQIKRGAGVRRFFLLAPATGEVLASAQAIEYKVYNKIYFYLPYGPVLAQATNSAWLAAELCRQLRKIQQNLIFVRVEPQLQPTLTLQKDFLGYNFKKIKDIQPHQTLILDITKDLEQLLANMHSKTRYNIKLAQRSNLRMTVRNEFSHADMQVFKITAQRAGISFYPEHYYRTLLEFFSEPNKNIYTRLYQAWHGQDLLGISIVLYYKGEKAVYLFGGSTNVKRNLQAPHMLQWQAIMDARKQGYKSYDFWGVEEDPKHAWAGISKFKTRFGGAVVNYAGAYDFVLNRPWYNVYIAARKLNRLIRK